MLIGRLGRPGILGLAARTAVVAGTAGLVNTAVIRHEQRRQQDAQSLADFEAQQSVAQNITAAPQPAMHAASPTASEDLVDRLERLAALHDRGVLTEAEFAAQKAVILGGR